MSKPPFRLDRVLEIRLEEERIAQRALATALQEVGLAEQRVAESEVAVSDLQAELRGAGGSVGHRKHILDLIEATSRELGTRRSLLDTAEQERRKAEEVLRGAIQQRDALERLKDRKAQQWTEEQARIEEKKASEARQTRSRDDLPENHRTS